ncbi:GntR family transcriptional regulator [Thermophagus xiamenensis]|uniref:Transcriptional regulator, GntR family n=1 Tax=Thermophagus xiamenensis TaxID=385682 RepID=A0A1I2BC55_9BACT|nr:GntR family transcriptional regulator [Thermophagus xiamenensis]SFE53468.1 transcriptional regulator, GntR family [Thermophagus xiamenensis]
MEEKSVPHYRRLYEQLRKGIVDGIYKEGDLLPSENELCALHNLTRPTVRKALDLLAHEGFIKKQQGLGSIVHKLPKGIGILSIAGTTTAIGKKNLKTTTVVRPRVQNWPSDFFFALSDEFKTVGCIYFERVRFVNDHPIFYEQTYLPNINLPRFTSRNLDNKSLFDLLRQNYQLEIKGGEQYLKAIEAVDEKICEYLNIRTGQPVLYLSRKLETNRINFSFFSFMYCNTSDFSLYGVF